MHSQDALELMDTKHALFGMLFAFQNRLQAIGDTFYENITSKQFFLLACMSLFPKEAPTAQELADVMGCSHQNVKQILIKLEEKGCVEIRADEKDRRKLRIYVTDLAIKSAEENHDREILFLNQLFDGISEEQALETYKTLMQMEYNLEKMRGETQ